MPLTILMYTLPAIIVLVGIYVVMSKMYKEERQRRETELQKQNDKVVLPIRLRAYERIVLFLSRTAPDSLLMRFDFSSLTVLQLQKMLLQTIRDEYEHNVSQQIYVSKETWGKVVSAKESIAQLINTCASRLDMQAPAIELAKSILGAYSEGKDTPIDIAINSIKQEMNKN